jgi:uncharacterized protein YndB with AHSA1/START domain
MSSCDIEVKVDATPERVWAIVGDRAGTDRWVAGVPAARVEGTRRICTLQDGGEIHEEIAVEAPGAGAYRRPQAGGRGGGGEWECRIAEC